MSQPLRKPIFATSNLDLSSEDQKAVQTIIALANELTGVQLTDRHQSMITSRLTKRLKDLKLSSLSEYVEYFYQNKKSEAPRLISLITTHHSFFFREFSHFEYLVSHALPGLLPAIKARGDNKLRIWVAACSRGQEVYSLAMYLDLYLKKFDPRLQFEILATDIDTESVAIAKNGVYLRNELKEVPLPLLGNHWVKGSGDIEAYTKVKETLRSSCRFTTANLLEIKSGTFPVETFDLIFCRNVYIYFNAQQIKSITQELLSRLNPTGYFFIGVSESLSGLNLPVTSPGHSVYQHKAAPSSLNPSVPAGRSPPRPPVARPSLVSSATTVPKPLRILCVDDSPSILAILKKILSTEHGFEVVGTAANGLEAAKLVATLKPDALTLDIHMPEQTGVEYLENNFGPSHPPVVMVTSVSRESAELAGRSLSLGAADYVEKPTLANVAERGEEIRNKLRCSVLMKSTAAKTNLTLDRSFQKQVRIDRPENKLRIIILPLSSRSKLKNLFQETSGVQPAALIFLEGSKEVLPALAETLTKESGRKVVGYIDLPSAFVPGQTYLLDFATHFALISIAHAKTKKTSILVYGDISKPGAEKILQYQGAHLLLEDLGAGKGAKALQDVASDIVPHTSFGYMSSEFFST